VKSEKFKIFAKRILTSKYLLPPASCFLLPASCFLFPASYFLFPISYFLFPISCFLFPNLLHFLFRIKIPAQFPEAFPRFNSKGAVRVFHKQLFITGLGFLGII